MGRSWKPFGTINAREILDAGAEDFIQKPFSIATLSEKLKGYFKSAAVVLKHGPLTPAAVPGLAPAFPQGMGAVVPGVIFKKMEIAASSAANQLLRVMFPLGMDFIDHSSLQIFLDYFFPMGPLGWYSGVNRPSITLSVW